MTFTIHCYGSSGAHSRAPYCKSEGFSNKLHRNPHAEFAFKGNGPIKIFVKDGKRLPQPEIVDPRAARWRWDGRGYKTLIPTPKS